jgi:hypothetical protein
MSAHSTYEPGYIETCVVFADRYQADNTGGGIVTVARDHARLAPYVVAALTHPFGVGGSPFRVRADQPRWVDTVFGGCYRRQVFERIGLFNEDLVRGQDMEFNLRLRRAGMRTLLVPSVRSVYHARSRFGEFLRHNWNNGVWAVLPFLYVDQAPVALRHLVPMGFALALATAIGLAVATGLWWPLALLAAAYGAGAFAAALDIARSHGELRFLVWMPFVFVSLHLSYGLGSVWGGIQLVVRRLASRSRR